jgi:predicted nucleotidyltransferase
VINDLVFLSKIWKNSAMLKEIRDLSIQEIESLLTPLYPKKDLQLLILFGSSVHGVRHPESDLDLAFLFDQPAEILPLTNEVIRLLHTDQVDVVDLRQASPLLAFSIARGGRLLYERAPGLYHNFYSLSFRRYVDTAKLRDAQAEAVQLFLNARKQG